MVIVEVVVEQAAEGGMLRVDEDRGIAETNHARMWAKSPHALLDILPQNPSDAIH